MTESEGLNFRSIEHMPRLVGVEVLGASDGPRSAAIKAPVRLSLVGAADGLRT
jgi:hypothetical protein